ncbi:MAG: peptide-methionine (S)-S-oxide reductase MsrA [Rhodocyclaceae bacterium]|nr:peptide-methionine (S)-S-oxide reductase MsrA [Rhodocyclaceae bacterium]
MSEQAPVFTSGPAVATLGGGCFWCTEAPLSKLKGVSQVVSGYAGGHLENPTYEDICTGTSGHAEVIQVTFDPAVIDYRTLLITLFAIHDPTTLNRQGNDRGTQYRSVIFTHDETQAQIARQLIAELEAAHVWDDPIVTEVSPVPKFWPAEAYHQDYFTNNPFQPYCMAVVGPKVQKMREKFGNLLKPGV